MFRNVLIKRKKTSDKQKKAKPTAARDLVKNILSHRAGGNVNFFRLFLMQSGKNCLKLKKQDPFDLKNLFFRIFA